MFKTGEDAMQADRDHNANGSRGGAQNIRGLGFIENPWGEKARAFVKTTKCINDSLWDTIIEAACEHNTELGVFGEDNDKNNDEDRSYGNPHTSIDLDW